MVGPDSFHSVRVTGQVDLNIRLGPELEHAITLPDNSESPDIEIRVNDGSVSVTAPAELEDAVSVEITAPTLHQLSAFKHAQVQLSGVAGSLKVVAFQRARVDASNLELQSAEVDLETSSHVSIAATNAVTGAVAYGARLKLVTEPGSTSIVTANNGWVTP